MAAAVVCRCMCLLMELHRHVMVISMQIVVFHEHTHGVSNRLIGNGSGLGTTQAGGMGEGWSDLFAFSAFVETDTSATSIYSTGGYVTYKCCGLTTFTTNYFHGIRRFLTR